MARLRHGEPWGMRRDARNGRVSHFVPPGVPLPASAIEYWDSELQCSPSAWVGQIGGRTLVGTGTPTVAVDGAFFNGRVAAQTASSGKYWSGTFAALAPAGSRPQVYTVARSRALDAATRAIVGGGNGGTAFSVGQRTTSRRAVWNNSQLVSNGVGTTNPGKWASWFSGTHVNLDIDGVLGQTIDASAMSVDLVDVNVGQQNGASQGHGDSSVVFYLICGSAMSGAEKTALDAYALYRWGV